jgi:hypothetical protein
MTTQKTFKQRVRARAERTGESYTAARAQLLRKSSAAPEPQPVASPEPVAPGPDPAPEATANVSGVSHEAMRRATGRTIAEWLPILDEWGASDHNHTEIARWLVSEHGIPGWWAQSVTVAYERARGRRAVHQVAGGFSVSVNKTVGVSADRLYAAFADGDKRGRWLPDAPLRERSLRAGHSVRLEWDEPASRVGLFVRTTGDDKAQATVVHEKLPDGESVERLRTFWRERLDELKRQLEG